jgi:hypothetical protein
MFFDGPLSLSQWKEFLGNSLRKERKETDFLTRNVLPKAGQQGSPLAIVREEDKVRVHGVGNNITAGFDGHHAVEVRGRKEFSQGRNGRK